MTIDLQATRPQRYALATLTLLAVAAAVASSPSWADVADNAALDWLLTRISQHAFVRGILTFALISICELLVRTIARLGKPVIGLTIINWVTACLLSITFYTLFGLTALFARVTGRIALPRYSIDEPSYWLRREGSVDTLEQLRKQ